LRHLTRLAPDTLAAIGLTFGSTAALGAFGLALTCAPAATAIVFCSDRDGDSNIYTMNDDGSAVRRITSNESNEFDTACSPDGLWVAFVSDRDGNLEIYVMRFDGTSVRRSPTILPLTSTRWRERFRRDPEELGRHMVS